MLLRQRYKVQVEKEIEILKIETSRVRSFNKMSGKKDSNSLRGVCL